MKVDCSPHLLETDTISRHVSGTVTLFPSNRKCACNERAGRMKGKFLWKDWESAGALDIVQCTRVLQICNVRFCFHVWFVIYGNYEIKVCCSTRCQFLIQVDQALLRAYFAV